MGLFMIAVSQRFEGDRDQTVSTPGIPMALANLSMARIMLNDKYYRRHWRYSVTTING
jgi:hypothetical protein